MKAMNHHRRRGNLQAPTTIAIGAETSARLRKMFAEAGCTEEGRAARMEEGARRRAEELAEVVRERDRHRR